MTTPVYEKFMELGCDIFINPFDVYEDFRSGGIFRRAQVSSVGYLPKDEAVVEESDDTRIAQRNVLFDLALVSGLSSVIGDYINGYEMSLTGKSFFLKDPIAVQQWAIRTLDQVRQEVEQATFSEQEIQTITAKLKGLQVVILALLDRIKYGSDLQEDYSSFIEEGVRQLLTLFDSAKTTLQEFLVNVWLDENALRYDFHKIKQLYDFRKRQSNQHLVEYHQKWQSNFVESNQLLIDIVLEAADLGKISVPPRNLSSIIVDCANLDSSLYLSLMLYFSLDTLHLSKASITAKEIIQKSNSFSQLLGLNENMRNAIVALWMSDSRISTYRSTAKSLFCDVGIIANLDYPVKVGIIKTFLLSGDCHTALVLLNVFHSVEYTSWSKELMFIALTIYLECGVWEQAIQFLRTLYNANHEIVSRGLYTSMMRIYFQWFEINKCVDKLVCQPLTFSEEAQLEVFLMRPRKDTDKSIRYVDLLIAYYLQRNQIEKAMQVDAEHQFFIQQQGHSSVLQAQSFKVRSALIGTYKNFVSSAQLKRLSQQPREANRFICLAQKSEEMEEVMEDSTADVKISEKAMDVETPPTESPFKLLQSKDDDTLVEPLRIVPTSRVSSLCSSQRSLSMYSPGSFSGKTRITTVEPSPDAAEEGLESREKKQLVSKPESFQKGGDDITGNTANESSSSLSFSKTVSLNSATESMDFSLTSKAKKVEKKSTPFKNIARRGHLRTPPIKPVYKPREAVVLSKSPLASKSKDPMAIEHTQEPNTFLNIEKGTKNISQPVDNLQSLTNVDSPSMHSPFAFMSPPPNGNDRANYRTPATAIVKLSRSELAGTSSVPVRRNPPRSARKKY